MDKPSKAQILAASSGWVATTLNFLPGLGAGYLYQRRWGPYLFCNRGSSYRLDYFRCLLKWNYRANKYRTNNWYRRIILNLNYHND